MDFEESDFDDSAGGHLAFEVILHISPCRTMPIICLWSVDVRCDLAEMKNPSSELGGGGGVYVGGPELPCDGELVQVRL